MHQSNSLSLEDNKKLNDSKKDLISMIKTSNEIRKQYDIDKTLVNNI